MPSRTFCAFSSFLCMSALTLFGSSAWPEKERKLARSKDVREVRQVHMLHLLMHRTSDRHAEQAANGCASARITAASEAECRVNCEGLSMIRTGQGAAFVTFVAKSPRSADAWPPRAIRSHAATRAAQRITSAGSP